MSALRLEIAEMFAALEGCADPNTLHGGGYSFFGGAEHDEARRVSRAEWAKKNPDKARQIKLEWAADNPERARKWARENPDKVKGYKLGWVKRNPEVVARNKRRARLKKNIEAWSAQVTLICIGRSLPAKMWEEMMKNPVSTEELEAFTDFVFFLRQCKRFGIKRIASMLETNEAEIRAALTSRGVACTI